jgi:hypothetical protein
MPTLDAEIGGTSANSYSEVADADTYFDERLQASVWTGESDPDVKERALIMGTRRVDAFQVVGFKNSADQALKWPRSDVFDEDGNEYETTEIPIVVLHATYETALWLLNQNAASTDPLAPDGLDRFTRAKVGPIEVEPNLSSSSSKVPDHVRRLLRHVLRAAGFTATLERA